MSYPHISGHGRNTACSSSLTLSDYVSLAHLKGVGRSQQRTLGRDSSMLPETHPALCQPSRPPTVWGEGEGSVQGCWWGDSGSDSHAARAKPQRGPGDRADTLLQNTSRHDGRTYWLLPACTAKKKRVKGSALRMRQSLLRRYIF